MVGGKKYQQLWLKINDTLKACNDFQSRRVVCIRVNVEKADTPEEQLLMHASLDALVGIHGSHFMNAVFLPRHSFILELLPWIKYTFGLGWAAKMQMPTPTGDAFTDTDIYHLGYCLGRESVPLCEYVDTGTSLTGTRETSTSTSTSTS